MKLKFYLLLSLCITTFVCFGKKTNKFPTCDIPEELKTNADAVIRQESEITEIISHKELKYHTDYAVTILNENGSGYGELVIFYDKSSHISNLKINIYNSEGKLIERVKSNKIEDYSASGSNLFSDNRVKHYKTIQSEYPYTIQYSYDKSYNGFINLNSWYPYGSYRCSVQNSKFEVHVSDSNNFRYKAYNTDIEPKVSENDGKKIFLWCAENLKALKKEPYSPPSADIFPHVKCATNTFSMEKVDGSMKSWKDFGKWSYVLNKNRDLFTPETENKIKELIKDCKNEREKVTTLYQYLQNKTRYVSIQVGIGGWQSFTAQSVEDKAYGDCKALSNYMKAMLKVAGIPSKYTLISAGRSHNKLDKDFVRNSFNHAILMVPLKQDTMWLECTDKYCATGFLGSFTDNREALCIDENGGELIHTPTYKLTDNTQIQSATIIIGLDGNAKAKIDTKYKGLQHSNVRRLFRLGAEDQKKYLYDDINLPDFKINSFSINEKKKQLPIAELNLDLDIRNYASKSGDRLFIPLNLMNRDTYIPKKIKNRKTDIYKSRNYLDIDSTCFEIPKGYEIESIPKNKSITSDFGSYEYTVKQDSNIVTYVRKVKYTEFRLPANRYEELRNFMKSKVRADKARLVIKKKN
jgi:hypothetical protein